MPNHDQAGPVPHLVTTLDHDSVEHYDLAAVPLVSIGADGAIRGANLAAAELLRQERSSLVNRQLASFVHEADRYRLREHLPLRCHAVRRACEVRLTLPNGSLVPVQLHTRASWRKPGIEYLTLVDLREREFDAWEKQQLCQAAVRARAANHTKERLIALLSRELRTKLVSTETRLLDELLDVTACTRGSLRVVRRLVDVNLLVADCTESLQALAERKGVALSFTPAADQGTVNADRSRLHLVFSTLLTTAIQVTPPGGSVCAGSRNSHEHLLVEVRDCGAGFDPEEGSRLLSTLDTLRDPATERGGLGLGLSLVRTLVELHGGRLTARSAGKNRGSSFLVELHVAPTVAAVSRCEAG